MSDVARILAMADVFVLASRWEGNPLAIMEAMAAGKPIIATTVGGVPELVDDSVHGFLVAPGDIAGFADAMCKLAEQPELRGRMSEAAGVRASAAFDVRAMVPAYERLYINLLGISHVAE